jgi:hypothetical protein
MRGIKREMNSNSNPRVRDLLHHCRTRSALVLDVGLREEEARPPDCKS